jgi:hypothetical protein
MPENIQLWYSYSYLDSYTARFNLECIGLLMLQESKGLFLVDLLHRNWLLNYNLYILHINTIIIIFSKFTKSNVITFFILEHNIFLYWTAYKI